MSAGTEIRATAATCALGSCIVFASSNLEGGRRGLPLTPPDVYQLSNPHRTV